MNDQDTSGMIWAFGSMIFVIALLIIVIWPAVAIWRAKATLARESEYRRIAEKAVTAQEETEVRLGQLSVDVGELRERMASLERILKEVE